MGWRNPPQVHNIYIYMYLLLSFCSFAFCRLQDIGPTSMYNVELPLNSNVSSFSREAVFGTGPLTLATTRTR